MATVQWTAKVYGSMNKYELCKLDSHIYIIVYVKKVFVLMCVIKFTHKWLHCVKNITENVSYRVNII